MVSNICVYQHIKLNDNTIFYIGIGNSFRPYSKNRRNNYWKNIVNKYDYKIEIIHENISWELACEIESYLILYYGRKDNNTGILCNMTNGGEGSFGRKMLNTTRDKIRIASTGNKNCLGRIYSKKTILKMSNSKLNIPLLKSRKKIINIKTNEIYDSILDVLKVYPVKKSWLYSALNGNRKNSSEYRYIKE